jgi:hypothetical protein
MMRVEHKKTVSVTYRLAGRGRTDQDRKRTVASRMISYCTASTDERLSARAINQTLTLVLSDPSFDGIWNHRWP